MKFPGLTARRSKLARNVVGSYLGFGVNALVTLVLAPFLIDALGQTTYGLWILLHTILGYFQMLELGTLPAVVRYVAKHDAAGEPEQVQEVVGSAAVLLLGASLLTLPLVALTARYGPAVFDLPEAGVRVFVPAVWLIGAAAVLSYFRRLHLAVLEGYQRFDLRNLVSVSGNVLAAVATIVFVARGHGIVTLIFILIARTAVETVVLIALLFGRFGTAVLPFRSGRAMLRKVAGFSVFAFLIDLAVTISHRIDVVVIGIFLPIASITHYDVATRLSGVLEKITAPMVETFYPLASELTGANRASALRRLLLEGTRISLVLTLPALLLLAWFGGDVIGWWVGPELVEPSLPVLHVFLGAIFMAVFDSTAARVLLGMGQVKFDAGVSLAIAVCNLGLSLLLVTRLGVVGVALGTLIPAALFNGLVSVPYTCRVTGTPILPFYAKVFAPLLVIGTAGLGFMVAVDRFVEHRVLALGLDAAFLAAVGGAIFLRLVRNASRDEPGRAEDEVR